MFNKDSVFSKDKGRTGYLERTPGSPRNEVDPARGSTPSRMASPETAEDRAARDAAAAQEPKGSRLIVGPNIKLKGAEIADCDTLVVEGRVEASMMSRVMEIAEQGVFSGTAGVDLVEIKGRFEGDLTARKRLVIYSTGRVSGKIRYGALSVEEGGEIGGDVGRLDAKGETQMPRVAAAEPAHAKA
jgi:cytoskeletal protein CcmA (bactofilin family)